MSAFLFKTAPIILLSKVTNAVKTVLPNVIHNPALIGPYLTAPVRMLVKRLSTDSLAVGALGN